MTAHDPRAVVLADLVAEAEYIRAVTGMGMARFWGYYNEGDLAAAKAVIADVYSYAKELQP